MADTLQPEQADVAVIGLGYVGLTLAIALATQGVRIVGYDSNPAVAVQLGQQQLAFTEPHLLEGLRETFGTTFAPLTAPPAPLPPIVVICVGTPLRVGSIVPDLTYLDAAVDSIRPHLRPETLLVIRSTVSVGTSRAIARRLEQELGFAPQVAFCPERTIQGKALEELRSLPQIVGGLTPEAAQRAGELFGLLTPRVTTVSSLEAAETIKLICNAHTDLLYGFGNEVALIAEHLGLDATELIRSANLDYPRPDLALPGFVGGSCLIKDPYLLIHSLEPYGHVPRLVQTARAHNEAMPGHVGRQVLAALRALPIDLASAKVCVAGFVYKGYPTTDDLRGGPTGPILEALRGEVGLIAGQDFAVNLERLRGFGVEPMALEQAITGASAVLVLNNHPQYRSYTLRELTTRMQHPGVFYDAWGLFAEQEPTCHPQVRYMRLGRG
ncbi:MAG: UDP-N-acetyl-D-mannosamine dehydrogenase [Roseiflexaceae bacterium]